MSLKRTLKDSWLPVYVVPLVLLSGVLAYFDNIGFPDV